MIRNIEHLQMHDESKENISYDLCFYAKNRFKFKLFIFKLFI